MNIKTYQQITSLDSGSTTYVENLVNIFNIDKTKPMKEIEDEIYVKMLIRSVDINNKTKLLINKKIYGIEKDLLELTFEQFSRLETILAEDDNINNLHKLLSIYVRPLNIFGKIKKFDINTQEEISNYLLNMDMTYAQSLMVFFFNNATSCMKNINTYYLNQEKMNMMESIKNK